jgi:hypothetical protein
MTANIQSAGTDLDTLFAAHVTNNAASATGYQVAGTDIQTRYDPLANPAQANLGSRIPATNIKTSATGWSANTDLATIFAGNAGQYSLTTPAGGTGSHAGFTSPITLTHTITITFASAAALTNYFNFGGRIQISASQSAGTSADTALGTMFTNMGTIVIYDAGHFQTDGSGGTVTNTGTGGSNIGTSSVALYNTTDGSPYTSTTYSMSMVANAAAGSATVLTITTTLTVTTAGTIADTYTGTYTSNVQQRNHSTQTVPTFSHTGP